MLLAPQWRSEHSGLATHPYLGFIACRCISATPGRGARGRAIAELAILAERNAIDCGKLPLREGRVGAKRTSNRRSQKEDHRMQQSGENQQVRPPVPPFTEETARQKVKMAQDAWNTRDPEKVSLAYTEDSKWRNREEFFEGREEIVAFLKRKWARELDYRLEKNLWCFTDNRIAVRFEYESHDESGQWWRSHGNELWEFDENGLMRRRDASINDYKIDESERKFRWTK